MRAILGHWRARLAVPVVALSILGAAVAPAATPIHAQSWGPWFPLPGWDMDFPPLGPMPAPFPLLDPNSLPPLPPLPGSLSVLGPNETRRLGSYLRELRSISRGNGADAMSLFTDDATYWFSDGVGGCSASPCVGRDAIRPEIERQISFHARFAPLGGDVNDTSVSGLWDIRSDRVAAAGSERVLGTITAEVRGDRIFSLRTTLVRDDPQTQRFITWLQGQPGGTAPAAPGAATTTSTAAPTAATTTPPTSTPPSAP